MKKTNNPFKMIGSWIGAILFFIIMSILDFLVVLSFGTMNIGILNYFRPFTCYEFICQNIFNPYGFYFHWIFILSIGFILGWLLTLLIRKIRGK